MESCNAIDLVRRRANTLERSTVGKNEEILFGLIDFTVIIELYFGVRGYEIIKDML